MKTSLFNFLLLVFLVLQNLGFAQQGVQNCDGEGIVTSGIFSFSFGQFAFRNYFAGSWSVAEGVQHPTEIYQYFPELYLLRKS